VNLKRSLLASALFQLSIPLLAQPQAETVEEIIVTAVRDTSELYTDQTLVAPPDTAQMLRRMPGANINKNGELTGIAQYRGMYGDRINVSINGSRISSGGPNAMDTPLHYAPVAILESLTVHRGITPVSKGQETLGGSVEARTYQGDFAEGDSFALNGRVYSGLQAVNEGQVIGTALSMANANHLFRASFLTEEADDSEFAGGKITPSEYERDRLDLGYGYRNGRHQFNASFAINNTGNAGTAALPMDILSIDSDLFHLDHQWEGDDFTISSSVSYNSIEHWMTNYHLRRPPQPTIMTPAAMRYRATFAESDNYGFTIRIEQPLDNGVRRAGIDGHFSIHDADISNPNAAMFGITNFNEAQRDIVGLFVEQEISLGSNAGIEAGLRINQVSMDAGQVGANLNPMNMASGMPVMMNNMAAMLASGFNNQALSRNDTNVDAFARLSLESGANTVWYLGAARKTRSPSYQERYLWLPMEATGGLADGVTYVGNVELSPEVSWEVEAGFDYEDRQFTFLHRVFYKRVDDYIQGTPSASSMVNQFAMMMANMGMGTGYTLQFNNTDATFYGVDIESAWQFNERLGVRANLSMVRGERRDIDDDLYRISPDNLLVALEWHAASWIGSIESIIYAGQDRVSITNQERETGGYGQLNLSARFYPSSTFEIGVGLNNLLDREYRDHLAGYNRAFNPDIAMRDRLPGLGRNLYGRLIWQF